MNAKVELINALTPIIIAVCGCFSSVVVVGMAIHAKATDNQFNNLNTLATILGSGGIAGASGASQRGKEQKIESIENVENIK